MDRFRLRGALAAACRRWSVMLLMLAALFTPARAHADRPAGVTAQTLALPSGPSGLKGLGESFAPNAAMGSGGYTVPLEVPPGFLAPSPTLAYAGGRGKSEVGQGWSLSLLQIYRQTDKGAPDFDETDRFAVMGSGLNDELVRVNEKLGYYRMKNEGGFALFIRDAEDDSWTIRLPSGQTSFLGSSAESRESSRGRTSRWFFDRQIDRFGHWSEYHYFKDGGHVYLSEIAYQLHAEPTYQNTVSFTYEDRPDVFTDYSYGEANTTALRLASVQMFHGSRLVRTYRLSYESGLLFSLLKRVELTGEGGLALPPLTFEYLADRTEGGELVTMKNAPPLDALAEGVAELDDVNADGLPDILVSRGGDYRYYENVDGRSFGTARSLKNSPDHDLGEPGVVFADANGDGFRDLVHAQGDHFRYYPGGDVVNGVLRGYGKPVELRSLSDSFSFTSPELKLGDQNHDGRIDLLWQKPGADSWLVNGSDNVLREQTAPELPVDVDFTDPQIDLTDFNGDGLLDCVRTSIGRDSAMIRVWFGLGHGEFGPETQVADVPKGDASEFQLRDVNRDGQADLLRISGSWATVYMNRGSLGFSGPRGDFHGLPATSDTLRLLFADMNGNGTTDIVWVTKDFKLRYRELTGEPHAGLLSRVDNGMGAVTEIAYRSSTEYLIEAKAAGSPWIHPLPTPVAVISELRTTDSFDSLGLRATETRTTYDYRDGYYDGKEREFRGFGESVTTSWGDASHETQVTRSKFHLGRNPTSLADEEVLKGKPLFQAQLDAAGKVFSAVETEWEQRWLCQEALPGVTTVLPRCRALGDLAGKKDQLVAIAVSPASLTVTYEKTSNPRYTFVATEFDAWGDAVRTANLGEVNYAGGYVLGQGFDQRKVVDLPGDEQVTTSETLKDVDQWLIGLPIEQGLEDANGTRLQLIRTYYDDLAFGEASAGLTSRVRKYDADGERWIDVERSEFDDHGNRVAVVNAAGDRSELRYDTAGNVFPNRERIRVAEEDWITFEAEHDLAYGQLIRSVGPSGQESRVELDGLGRVARTFAPGSVLPIARYEYTFGTPAFPVSVVRTDTLIEDSGRYHSRWTYSDGAGRTRQQKETAEQPNGFVSSGWTDYSSRGVVVARFDAFFSAGLGLEAPPAGTPVTRVTVDAMGRPLLARRPATSDLPSGSVSRTEYHPLETRAYTEKEASLGNLRHPVTTRVDGLGRVIEMRKLNRQHDDEQELVWRVGYDARGSITSFADPAWNGRADDARHLRRYSYDSLGRLRVVRDPNAGRTDYEVDDLDRIVKRTDALGQTQTWTYGAAGRLLAHAVSADARGGSGYQHKYHYDAPAPNSPLDGPSSSNLRGRLSWLEFPTGEQHYGYDERGRLREEAHRLWNPATSSFAEQQRDTFKRKLAYRADGRITRDITAGGLVLDYGYDERGNVSRLDARLGQQNKTVLANARYDHRGAGVASDLGNGIRICNSFNERGELTVAATAKANRLDCAAIETVLGGLRNLRYARGYDGLISSIEDRSDSDGGLERLDAEYEYDDIQQLVRVSDAKGSASLAYDQVQNLVRREVVGDAGGEPTGNFAYGEGGAGPNALTSAGGKTYTYDAAGQMLRYAGYDLRFNSEGQLAEANNVTSGVRLVQHYDDAGDRRVALLYRPGKPVEIHRFVSPEYQIHDGEEVWLAGAGLGKVEIVRSQGVKVDAYLLDGLTQYVNGVRAGPKPVPAEYMDLNGDGQVMNAADLALAQQSFANETRVGGEKLVWRFSSADHLGSVSQSTDSQGDLVLAQHFRAYGKLATRAGQPAYRGGYLGKDTEVDADLGLQRIGARYYAAALGRWVTPDPLIGQDPREMVANPVESNLYSYSRNNPVMFRDPLGLQGKTALVVANAESTVKKRDSKGNAVQDRYQENARTFAKKYEQKYTKHETVTLTSGELARFATDDQSQKQKGRAANYRNQEKLLSAIDSAAKAAGEGGTVVLIGHGGIGRSDALFQMGAGDTAFYLDKTEVFQGRMDDFLAKVGASLKAHKVESIRFAGCLIGKDLDYAQTLANKLGIKAEFDSEYLGFSDRGTFTVHQEVKADGSPGKETDARTHGLVKSQVSKSPQAEGDPNRTDAPFKG